jgi:DNA-binding protein H-NS
MMKRRDGEYAKSARAADIYTSCRSETKRKAARRAARCGLCQNRQRQTWTGGRHTRSAAERGGGMSLDSFKLKTEFRQDCTIEITRINQSE